MMALIVCPQCQHRVSSDAVVCPSCGHPIAADTKQKAQSAGRFGCGTILLLVVGFIAWAVYEGGQIEEQEKANPTCVSDYTKCSDNKDVVENHHTKSGVSMKVACQVTAEDAAKYGTPKFSFLPFGSYYEGRSYIDSGTAILIENGAQFQNGFGAYEHVTATCLYDMKNDKAVVTISPQ
jgi:hypothetical protein